MLTIGCTGYVYWFVENSRGLLAAKPNPVASATAVARKRGELLPSVWTAHEEETAGNRIAPGEKGARADALVMAAAARSATIAERRHQVKLSDWVEDNVEDGSARGAEAGHGWVPVVLDNTLDEEGNDGGFRELVDGIAGVPEWARPSQGGLEEIVRNQVSPGKF